MSDSINQMILTFLDRMIDENVKNAEALTNLRSAIFEQRVEVSEILKEMKIYKKEFTSFLNDSNEKQSIILNEILTKIETEQEKKDRLAFYKRVDKFMELIKSPKAWLAIIASILIALSGLVGGVATIVYRLPLEFKEANKESQNSQPAADEDTTMNENP